MIGIDILETQRIKKKLEKPDFINKILTQNEQEEIKDYKDKTQKVAGIFCAKEAVKKASTMPEKVGFLQMEILHEPSGKPYVSFSEEVPLEIKNKNYNISISHSKTVAVAVAVII